MIFLMRPQKRLVSHSRVLDPQHRPMARAYPIIQHLTQKAAARLRRYGFYARKLGLSVRFPKTAPTPAAGAGIYPLLPTQDTFVFLNALQGLWDTMRQQACHPPPADGFCLFA